VVLNEIFIAYMQELKYEELEKLACFVPLFFSLP